MQRSLRRAGQRRGKVVRPPCLPSAACILGAQGRREISADRWDGGTESTSTCVLDSAAITVDLRHQHDRVVLTQRERTTAGDFNPQRGTTGVFDIEDERLPGLRTGRDGKVRRTSHDVLVSHTHILRQCLERHESFRS
jgi:hypothetical protein